MARKALLHDTDLCYGCHTCEIACKQEHALPAGPRFVQIMKYGPKRVGGKLVMSYSAAHCQHCAKPACVEACPEKAISQKADGAVLINEDLCIGCMSCVQACPFGAPQFNEEKGVVQKCDLCQERVAVAGEPACVFHCPIGAMFYGDPNEFAGNIRKRKAKAMIEGRLANAAR
jgi:Fe-S-cluster-containing dehydrogenase component